jgi:AcrR family transcriptional regulator
VRRGRGRPAGGQPVADRDVVLDAAERVIARDGGGASLEAIADEAGVTKPSLYAKVGGRADLSNALAERLADRMVRAVSSEVRGVTPDRSALATVLRVALETIGAHRNLFLFVTRGGSDDTAERALFLAARSAAPMAELLRSWREANGDDVAVALPWAYGIVGMLNLAALWWLDGDDRSAAELADQLADLLWSGIGPRT